MAARLSACLKISISRRLNKWIKKPVIKIKGGWENLPGWIQERCLTRSNIAKIKICLDSVIIRPWPTLIKNIEDQLQTSLKGPNQIDLELRPNLPFALRRPLRHLILLLQTEWSRLSYQVQWSHNKSSSSKASPHLAIKTHPLPPTRSNLPMVNPAHLQAECCWEDTVKKTDRRDYTW